MRIFQYYIRGSFTFSTREDDFEARSNGWAGVVKAATSTNRIETVCIIHEQNVIDGRNLASSLISGIYRDRIPSFVLSKAWNTERTMIHFSIGNTLLFSVPIREDLFPNEAIEFCRETSNVIYHLLTRGLLPDSYREDQPVESINSIRSEQINSTRPRRSSGAQIAIENTVKVDDEILEDTFTCNMLIDRIKNCDTICSSDKKIKIIVREDSNEMMIVNTVFDDNILVIDVDNVKEKELDTNDWLKIHTADGLWAQIDHTANNYSMNMENIDGLASISNALSGISNRF